MTLLRSQDSWERIFGSRQDSRCARVVPGAANGKRPSLVTPLCPAPAPLPVKPWHPPRAFYALGCLRTPGSHALRPGPGWARWWRCKERQRGSCSKNEWKGLYLQFAFKDNTNEPLAYSQLSQQTSHSHAGPAGLPEVAAPSPRRRTDRFWHGVKKVEAADLPPAPLALCGSRRWDITQHTPIVVGKMRVLRAPVDASGTTEPFKASHPCLSGTGLCFPEPHNFSGLAIEAWELAYGSPSPAHHPGARVNLLFSKLCLLPGFTLLQAQGGGGGRGWPRHTPQLRQPTPEGTRLGPYLGNPNLVLALSSLIATVSPCPLGWVSRRGEKKEPSGLHASPLPAISEAAPAHAPTLVCTALPGKGEHPGHTSQTCSRDPEPFSWWVFIEYSVIETKRASVCPH